MESRKKQLDRMEKETNETIERFDIQMLGTGMFSDLDKIIEEKKQRKLKEKENET